MGGTAIPNSKKPKKRWRIGGIRSKSKSKDIAKEVDEDHTDPTTPESSSCSLEVGSNGSQEDLQNLADLPPAMSEVDDSDSDDEDLYLESTNDRNDGDDNNLNNHQSSYTRAAQPRDDSYNSDSSFEEDMKRHRKERRSSPHFSKELAKIAEDSDEIDNANPFDGGYDKNSFDDSNKSSSNNPFDDDDDDDYKCPFEVFKNKNKNKSSNNKGSNNNLFGDDDEDEYKSPFDDYENSNSKKSNSSNPFGDDEDDYKSPFDNNQSSNNSNNPFGEDDDNIEEALPPKKAQPIVAATPIQEKEPTDDEEEKIELPTHKELSKTLCKIVATEHYSGRESLFALEQLSKWAHTQESNLLKHFLTYGGVVKVIDYLDEQIDAAGAKPPRPGDFLLKAIHKAADVICNVCFVGKHGINEDIAIVNATVVVKYGGIETLLRASDCYNKSHAKNDPIALKAVEGIWNAIMNVYCNAEAAVTKEISIMVVDAAVEIMSGIGSVDHAIATETLANVFNSLYRITYHGFVSKEEFQQKKLLTHCLNVFKRDVTTSSEGDEELLEEAISFLYGCHEKCLLRKGSDYESVLPLCVLGLREFAEDNENIREWASKLLDGACSNIENRSSIMMAEGAIEVIAPFLTFKEVDEEDKEFMRNLIRKIVAPV